MESAKDPSADAVMEQLARHLAPLVAPLVADQLAGREPARRREYDEATCDLFVRELGQGVLNKAQTFFGILKDDGRVSSVELAEKLSLAGPRDISGSMTTSLKQRASALGLELPWVTTSAASRTIWVDRDGIAERMYAAVHEEQARRGGFGEPS